MTREEAIRILDPETMGETLAEIEYYNGFAGKTAAVQAVSDACVLAVAALREQGERRWIPVTERLPEINDKARDWSVTVLFRTIQGYIHSGYRNVGSLPQSYYDDNFTPPYWLDESENLDFDEDEVTHWMPLPEPPKGE